jgi:pyrroline-5-carboxylate reductase
MERLGLLGCGRIAEAMVGGLVASGYPPELICGASRTGAGAGRLADRFGVRAVGDVPEVVRRATLVVLAVDPEATTTVLRRLAGAFDGRHCLVSVAASRNVRDLEAVVPGVPVIRAVPNAAVAVRSGVTALVGGTTARPAHRRRAAAVFERLGVVAEVDEGLLDLVGTVFGIGPALFAQVAVEWAGAAVARGLDAGQAGTLVRQCLRGTGRLLEESTPEQIVARVASPNGMTEAALRGLDDGGLGAVLGAALDAAIRRSIERQGG